MSLFKSTYIAALALAGSCLLVGCGNGTNGSSGDGSASTASAGGGSATKSAESDSSSSDAGGSSAAKGSGSSSGGAGSGEVLPPDSNGGGKGGHGCRTRDLTFEMGGVIAGDQQSFPVVLTNKGTTACTMRGFPGVDLRSASGSWSLARSGSTPRTVTLAPGKTAEFTVTYAPWEEGDGEEFKAHSLVVTPPGETTSKTLAWPGDSVLRQDAATSPGTYVGPVGG
ncbi:DUF4232 domain-containing protein [Streptomyces sp900105245]|uniref:DUF4232 domain-containing protein n=1 Tax=Streptomyces sp. 900105245 TaxID=3154379 RepID=A0ABV1UI13_9ACTN